MVTLRGDFLQRVMQFAQTLNTSTPLSERGRTCALQTMISSSSLSSSLLLGLPRQYTSTCHVRSSDGSADAVRDVQRSGDQHVPVPIQHTRLHQKAAYIPWVFSRHQTPMRHVANRMGFLMECLEREQESKSIQQRGQHIDDFTSGDILEVRMKVPETGGTEYIFKGLCIARYNKGIRTSFKLYNIYPESGPVIQHIPLHMPDLVSVKVVGKVPYKRRSKLYYLIDQPDRATSYETAPLMVDAASGQAKQIRSGGSQGKEKSGKKKKA